MNVEHAATENPHSAIQRLQAIAAQQPSQPAGECRPQQPTSQAGQPANAGQSSPPAKLKNQRMQATAAHQASRPAGEYRPQQPASQAEQPENAGHSSPAAEPNNQRTQAKRGLVSHVCKCTSYWGVARQTLEAQSPMSIRWYSAIESSGQAKLVACMA